MTLLAVCLHRGVWYLDTVSHGVVDLVGTGVYIVHVWTPNFLSKFLVCCCMVAMPPLYSSIAWRSHLFLVRQFCLRSVSVGYVGGVWSVHCVDIGAFGICMYCLFVVYGSVGAS